MKKIMMILMVAALALPTMAQNFNNQDQPNSVQFQSTSTLQGSGSQYSANPSINADGTAYNPAEASQSAAQTPNGPRKIGGTTPNTPPGPIGDAVLPLMLMALAFGGVIYLRRRKALKC